jgi:hypothetical protein
MNTDKTVRLDGLTEELIGRLISQGRFEPLVFPSVFICVHLWK